MVAKSNENANNKRKLTTRRKKLAKYLVGPKKGRIFAPSKKKN